MPPDDTDATIRDLVAEQGQIVGVLVAVQGTLVGQAYVLYDGENTIGRDDGCRIVLDGRDKRISRRHASIVHSGDSFGIEPLGSQPTRVNGSEIEKGPLTKLSDGDRVYLGWTEFQFRTITTE